LGALDKKLREEMQLEIKRIQKELNITTISVTHDQAETLVMSDKVAVMRDGRIEQIDTPLDLYERPASRFVADFIGESNILAINPDDQGRFRTEDGIHLPGTENLAASSSGWVVVRPEKIHLNAEATGQPSIPAVVEEVIYGGDVDRYRVRLGKSSTIIAKQQRHAGNAPLQPGASVHVHWSDHDCAFLRQ